MKPHASPTAAALVAVVLAAAAAPAAAQHGQHAHGHHDQGEAAPAGGQERTAQPRHDEHGEEPTNGGHDTGGHDHAAHLRAAQAARGEVEKTGGLSIPDLEVTTQDGDTVRFYRDLVEGRVVAINFVFTTCTTVCPPMGAIFGQLEKRLGDRAGRDVHLISVSVDPATDTPERLAEWADRFGRRPGWTLVTGDKPTIDRLLKALEVFTADFEDHAPVVLLGNDAAGAWTRAYGLAPPADLAAILDRLAAAEARQEPATAARGAASGL